MKLITVLTLIVLLCSSQTHADDEYSTSNNSLSAIAPMINNNIASEGHKENVVNALKQITYATEQFSLEFLKRLSQAVTAFNYDFIVSPFSIWSLLVLTAEGASGNTYTQLQQVLRLPEDISYLRMAYKHVQDSLIVNTSTVQVDINQVLFSDLNRPVDNEFSYKLEHIYEADHIPVNFMKQTDTYTKINQYVNEKTHGKIPKIVNMDDLREAQMILISALFFRGQWKVCWYFLLFCSLFRASDLFGLIFCFLFLHIISF